MSALANALAVPAAPSPEVMLSRPSIEVLRVRYRGWTAELRGATVFVVEQRCTNGSDLTDLVTCIALAQSYAPRPEVPAPVAETPAPGPVPAAGPRPAAAAVLRAAAQIATRSWDRRYCDLYACLNRSWADHGHAVAYTALTAPMRHLVERGNLLNFNDTHLGSDVVALFNAAAELVERNGVQKRSRGAA